MNKIFFALLLVLSSSPFWGQTPRPAGNQFQVNTYTTGGQTRASLAELPGQGFVVVWESPSELDPQGIRGQIFDSDSNPIGQEFQVNSETSLTQARPFVLNDAEGGFSVLWSSYQSSWGRHFSSSGLPVGDDFQVSSDSSYTSVGTKPQATMTGSGDYIVAWIDSWAEHITARLFDSDWNNLGPQFEINTTNYDGFFPPSLAPLNDGGFIVVWSQHPSVRGLKYSSFGDRNGAEFTINTVDYSYGKLNIASGETDDFLVVWSSFESNGSDTSGTSIQGRLLSSTGTPQGIQFQVNASTTGNQVNPSVTFDGRNDFLVVWGSEHDGVWDIMGQRVFSSRGFLGEEFLVSSHRANHYDPKVSLNGDDQYLMVWSSDDSLETDQDQASAQGRAFLIPIFGDGFEGGNTDAWSSVSP